MRALHVGHLGRVLAFALLACGSTLPEPGQAPQVTSALVQVPYPPPPARVEFVPAQPAEGGAVWIDGEWTWTGRRWAWKYGRWVVPPAGAAFARWTTVRDRDATLYYAPGVWRDASGRELEAPPALAVAKASQEPVVAPEGEVTPTGVNVRPEGAPRRARRRAAPTEPPPTLDPGFFGDAGVPGDGGVEPPAPSP